MTSSFVIPSELKLEVSFLPLLFLSPCYCILFYLNTSHLYSWGVFGVVIEITIYILHFSQSTQIEILLQVKFMSLINIWFPLNSSFILQLSCLFINIHWRSHKTLQFIKIFYFNHILINPREKQSVTFIQIFTISVAVCPFMNFQIFL